MRIRTWWVPSASTCWAARVTILNTHLTFPSIYPLLPSRASVPSETISVWSIAFHLFVAFDVYVWMLVVVYRTDAQDVVLIIAAKEFLPLRRIIRSLNFREFPLPAGYVVGVDGTVMCVDTGKNAVVSAISVRTSWLPLEVSIGMPGWRELNTVEERRYRVAEALPMSHPFDQTAFKIRPSRVVCFNTSYHFHSCIQPLSCCIQVSVRRLPPSHVDAVNALSKVLDVKMSWSSVHPIDSAMEQFYPLDLAIDTAINSSSTTTSARILFI